MSRGDMNCVDEGQASTTGLKRLKESSIWMWYFVAYGSSELHTKVGVLFAVMKSFIGRIRSGAPGV